MMWDGMSRFFDFLLSDGPDSNRYPFLWYFSFWHHVFRDLLLILKLNVFYIQKHFLDLKYFSSQQTYIFLILETAHQHWSLLWICPLKLTHFEILAQLCLNRFELVDNFVLGQFIVTSLNQRVEKKVVFLNNLISDDTELIQKDQDIMVKPPLMESFITERI